MTDKSNEFKDFNDALRALKIRFVILGRSEFETKTNALVYAFPANSYRIHVNNNTLYPAGSPRTAFNRDWNAQTTRHNLCVNFDTCAMEAGEEFQTVNNWPVFVEITRMLGSGAFGLRQIPVRVIDLSGKTFDIGVDDPLRYESRLISKLDNFRDKILNPMIEAMREDYFTENVQEVHTTSVMLMRTWRDLWRMAESINGGELFTQYRINRQANGVYGTIQQLRTATTAAPVGNDRLSSPCVVLTFPDGIKAVLSATCRGDFLPLKQRAKIHFSFELLDHEHSYSGVKQLLDGIRHVRLRDDTSLPTKRRKIILEKPHGSVD